MKFVKIVIIFSMLGVFFAACGTDLQNTPSAEDTVTGQDKPVTDPAADPAVKPDEKPVQDPNEDPTPDDTAQPDEESQETDYNVDTETEYSPAALCTFEKRDDVPTTQLWIGDPSWTFTANETIVRAHMPSKLFAMFLGFIQEQYGINPNFQMAIAGKESMAVFEDEDGGWLYPEAVLGNPADGPFQFVGITANSAMAEMANAYPSRVTSYDVDYHSSFADNFDVSTVLISLYLNWEEAYLGGCEKMMFGDFLLNAGDPDVLFKILAYGYNRGVFDSTLDALLITNRAQCIASEDIVTDCALNGESEYTENIDVICANFATADNVYDEAITSGDVTEFFDKLAWTYPAADIDWNEIKAKALQSFDDLADVDGTISIRYHWIPILRQILPFLPPKETPSGNFSDYTNSARCK